MTAPNALIEQVKTEIASEFNVDPQEIVWEDILQTLVRNQLKFNLCGCGPGSLARAKGLVEFLEKVKDGDLKWFYEDGQTMRFVICDLMENANITEHGGSAPGWLTEKGHVFLQALQHLVMLGNAEELDDALPAADTAKSKPRM